jgi:hypothetical protein
LTLSPPGNWLQWGVIMSICLAFIQAESNQQAADAVLMVTARDGDDALWQSLKQRQPEWQDAWHFIHQDYW